MKQQRVILSILKSWVTPEIFGKSLSPAYMHSLTCLSSESRVLECPYQDKEKRKPQWYGEHKATLIR